MWRLIDFRSFTNTFTYLKVSNEVFFFFYLISGTSNLSLENNLEKTAKNVRKFDLIGLKLFKDLNVKDLIICCSEICPAILCEEDIVNIDYEINFLEFYEIIIICTDRIFYNKDYEKWKTLEEARISELEILIKASEKGGKEKKKKKGK